MRPAIDYCDTLLWDGEQTAPESLKRLLESGGEKGKAAKIYSGPLPTQASVEQQRDTLKKICAGALLGIQSVIANGRCRLDKIGSDLVKEHPGRARTFPGSRIQGGGGR